MCMLRPIRAATTTEEWPAAAQLEDFGLRRGQAVRSGPVGRTGRAPRRRTWRNAGRWGRLRPGRGRAGVHQPLALGIACDEPGVARAATADDVAHQVACVHRQRARQPQPAQLLGRCHARGRAESWIAWRAKRRAALRRHRPRRRPGRAAPGTARAARPSTVPARAAPRAWTGTTAKCPVHPKPQTSPIVPSKSSCRCLRGASPSRARSLTIPILTGSCRAHANPRPRTGAKGARFTHATAAPHPRAVGEAAPPEPPRV